MFLFWALIIILLHPKEVHPRLDCSGLDVVSCHLKDRCVWQKASENCVFVEEIDCTEIVEIDACSSLKHCAWTGLDKCVDKAVLNCSSLTSKLPCLDLRKFGCSWLHIEDNFKCLHEKAVPCEKLQNELSCRPTKKCQWLQQEKLCIKDEPRICPSCSGADCSSIPKCKKGEESITMNGECCPTCVNREDCNVAACPAPRCFEGEEVVLEPGDCCPKCKKSCSCPVPDCTKVLCPPSPSCPPDAMALVLPGECCKKCVKDTLKCRGVSCKEELTCSVGEVVETPPGECCPVCKKQKTCSCEYEQPEEPNSTCAKPDCSDVWCAKPTCESFFGTNAIPEGECCPKCFPLFKCDSCPELQCKEGERVVQDRGSCCPRCQKACGCKKPDCGLVDCSKRQCGPDEDPVLLSGGCCNICVKKPSCDATCDPPPVCKLGEVLVKEPGSCCLVCKNIPCVIGIEPIPTHCINLDCSKVRCPSYECGAGEVEFVPDGSCCAECALKPECSDKTCNTLRCEPGAYEFKHPRSCCAGCRKECWI